MSIIQERTDRVLNLIQSVKEHCMCLNFVDDGGYFMVVYPDGDFQVHGTRIDYRDLGKAKALSMLLEKIEMHWKESFF